jgi:hypothetical protein
MDMDSVSDSGSNIGEIKYLVSYDVEHEGQGEKAFAIGFAVIEFDDEGRCVRNEAGDPDPANYRHPKVVRKHSVVATDPVNQWIAQTKKVPVNKDRDPFWTWPENLKVLKAMPGMATDVVHMRVPELGVRVREIMDKIYEDFPTARWVSDTAGHDMSAVNHLMYVSGQPPMHFHGDKYMGWKFSHDADIPNRTAGDAGNHDAGDDAVHIGLAAATNYQASV